ncbi:MAG TPA: DUF202 domain-containing protein [Prolixibacteraceae bacterium]|nr:DUF202 domain-containing protein [Prolixibacteraceae bacterium]HOS01091.1 DUF202 domain-containing protein [Prolixibacteraceae bacterium]HOS90979.1 DUF202 domain-containing protein [Prolixibacteraceae bacterium]HPL46222.1 DUF202 domain-containing protein [Prolixibacteraceae bacterium]
MRLFGKNLKFENREAIILRDYLAIERTHLANERTLMAYIRTALYLILAGIAFIQVQGLGNLIWLGIASLAAGLVFFLVGIYRYFLIARRLKAYYSRQKEEAQQD